MNNVKPGRVGRVDIRVILADPVRRRELMVRRDAAIAIMEKLRVAQGAFRR